MIILDNVAVTDQFPNENAQQPAAIMFPAVKSNGGYFTIANNPVYIQLAYNIGPAAYGYGQSRWTKAIPFPVGPGIILPGTVGIRFRNYTPGKVANISGALAEEAEPSIEVTSSGNASASTSLTNITPIALASFPPASPADGDIVVLALPSTYDPVAGKSIRWLFQFNATDNAWNFLGGPPIYSEVVTAETCANDGVWRSLTTVGPQFTIPRPGDYEIEVGAFMNQNGTANTIGNMSYTIAGVGPNVDDGIQAQWPNAATPKGPSSSRVREKTGIAASALILAQYQASGAGGINFSDRYMTITPVRIT